MPSSIKLGNDTLFNGNKNSNNLIKKRLVSTCLITRITKKENLVFQDPLISQDHEFHHYLWSSMI